MEQNLASDADGNREEPEAEGEAPDSFGQEAGDGSDDDLRPEMTAGLETVLIRA